jgi:hypothetical protein
MQRRAVTGVLSLAFIFSGCVLSVEPVVSEADAIFDGRLLGTWESEDERAVVSRAGGNSYAIEWWDEQQVNYGSAGRFGAHLGRLGDRLVLDVWPEPAEDEVPSVYEDVLIPGHLLFSIELDSDVIRVATVSDSLETALQSGEVRLSHNRIGPSVFGDGRHLVLFGTTEELQSSLAAFINLPDAFEEPTVFRKTGLSIPAHP